VLAALTAGCSSHTPEGAASVETPTTAPDLPQAASAPRGVSPEGRPAGPARDASPGVREKVAIDALRGEANAKQLPVEATEPGQTLNPSLRDTLSPRTKPPSIRMGKTTVLGRLPPEVIQRIVRQNFGRFRRCYDAGLARDPELQGIVEVHFTIDQAGETKQISERGSTLKDAEVKKCVTDAFTGLSFPQPEGGVVTVTYPIQLEPPT